MKIPPLTVGCALLAVLAGAFVSGCSRNADETVTPVSSNSTARTVPAPPPGVIAQEQARQQALEDAVKRQAGQKSKP